MSNSKFLAVSDDIFDPPEPDQSILEITEAAGGLHLKWCSGHLCMITNWEGGLRVLRKSGADWAEGSILHDNWVSMLLRWRTEDCTWFKSIPQHAISQASNHRPIEFSILRMAARSQDAYARLLDSHLSVALLYDHCVQNGLKTHHLIKYAECQLEQMYQVMAIPYNRTIAHFINRIELKNFNKSDYSRIKKVCRANQFPEDWIDMPRIDDLGIKVIELLPKLMGGDLLNNMISGKNGLSLDRDVLEILSDLYFFLSDQEIKKLGMVKTIEELKVFRP